MTREITVSIKDEGQESPDVYSLTEDSVDPITRKDLYKLHLKEAWDQHRYFGTLRAVVTWTPLIIVMLALDRLPWGDVRWPTGWLQEWFWLPIQYWIVIAVGVLTFAVQYWLQLLQRYAHWQSSELQMKLIEPDSNGPVSYGTLLNAVRKNKVDTEFGFKLRKKRPRRWWPDLATAALFLFLGVLVVALCFTRNDAGGASDGTAPAEQMKPSEAG